MTWGWGVGRLCISGGLKATHKERLNPQQP